jgi:RimJ/RimL family protein N-acetyltransferase
MANRIISDQSISPNVSIRPWAEGDLTLLRCMNIDEMWEHLGGIETEEEVIKRHHRYLNAVPGKTRMFAIMFGDDPVGNVGYWERRWQDRDVYEAGWGVLPNFQGQGIAVRATSALLDILSGDVPQAVVHAFPSVDNPASNAICNKLGFSLVGATEFEVPPGTWMKCNDWRIELLRMSNSKQ